MRVERLAVIATTFNRRDVTARWLSALELAIRASGLSEVRVFVAEDGSSDGTWELLSSYAGLSISLVRGVGDWYWAKGMENAEKLALNEFSDATHLLWLNDDVELDKDFLVRLVGSSDQADGRQIVVGAVRHEATMSYGGLRRIGRSPTRLRPLDLDDAAQTIDTFHGNIVLVPVEVARVLGSIDGGFSHGYADNDYGLRAREAGILCRQAPGSYGVCPRNPIHGTWRDCSLRRWERIRKLIARKGILPSDQLRYVRRHGGILWPVWFAASYAKPIVSIVLQQSASE